MPKKKDATPEEALAAYEADLAERDQQIAVLNDRVKELAGYQKEAFDGRDQIAKLGAQVDVVGAERDAANAAASNAISDRKAVAAVNASNAEAVEAAKALAAAIKKLS